MTAHRLRPTIRLLAWVFVASFGAAGSAEARQGTWQAHTSMRSVGEVAPGADRIWAATSGGVFSYDPDTGELERFTVVDGLHGVNTSTLAVDVDRRDVWIGYPDGVLDRLDMETGVVRPYRDIARADQFASRGINRIVVYGDELYIATDFGVVVFDVERAEVRDSYTRLGDFEAGIAAYDVIQAAVDGENRVWVATEEGLAHAPASAPNLQDPSVWSTETEGLPAGNPIVRRLAIFQDRLYVAGDIDLWERTAFGFEPLGASGRAVRRAVVLGDLLIATERFSLIVIDATGVVRTVLVPGYENPLGLAVGSDGSLWVGDDFGGLLEVVYEAGAVTVTRSVVPEGPAESSFTDLAIADDGTLWVGGFTNSFSGFHRRDPSGEWTAYTPLTRPELESRSRYLIVDAESGDEAWAGSEGSSLAHVTPDGTIEVYDESNSSLRPASGTDDYTIIGGIDGDDDGALWVTTRASGVPLHRRDADGSWTAFPPYIGDGLTSRSTAYGRILVDSYDQKWIVLHDENNLRRIKGLMVVATGADPTSAADDAFRAFLVKGAAGQGLPGIAVSSVVEDRDGLVWVGTDSGIAYFINTGIVARDANARAIWPPWADRSQGTFVLFGLQVNDLAVDPANRLWVATSQGAYLIDAVEAGYALVEHFTAQNSPLFSNEVISVAVDERSGEVYFATDRGLISYAGDAIAPAASADDLHVYPNPFRPDEGSGQVTIEGLVEETDVRIVTPGGVVVASFGARGGRVRWSGLDDDGRPVPTGMYLVVAVGSDGTETAYGRLALIR